MKVTERNLDLVIKSLVDINMQFCFIPSHCKIDVIFILCQLHEKCLGKHKPMHFALIQLENAFDCLPKKVLWWVWEELQLNNG